MSRSPNFFLIAWLTSLTLHGLLVTWLLIWQSEASPETQLLRGFEGFSVFFSEPVKAVVVKPPVVKLPKLPKFPIDASKLTPASSPPIDRKWEGKYLYSASELEVQPSPLGEIKIAREDEFSLDASGYVQLLLIISESGEVKWVGVDASDLDQFIIQQVLQSFSDARFSPGLTSSGPVVSLIRVQVDISKSQAD